MTIQDKPGRGDNRALMWMGHYSVWFIAVWAPLNIAADIGGTPRPLTWAAVASMGLLGSSLVFQYRYHDQRLCERCISGSPLNPQAEVDRWNRVLRLYHSPAAAFLMMGVVLAVIVTASLVHPKPLEVASGVFLILAVVVYLVFSHVHRYLYPWCPWCNWEDGGDEELVPDLPELPQETR